MDVLATTGLYITFIHRGGRVWPCGLMDKALPSGGRDCGFESHQGRYRVFVSYQLLKNQVADFYYHNVNKMILQVQLSTFTRNVSS